MIGRGLYVVVGVIALALAIAGALLPLLPTTPFLLVAAWAFARGSPRFEAMLLGHARFGPLIADWRREGAVGRRAKRVASVVMLAAVGLSVATGVAMSLVAIQLAVLVAVSIFLWTRPEPRRSLDGGPDR